MVWLFVIPMYLKKIITICIALMILTPSFSFALETDPSGSSSGSISTSGSSSDSSSSSNSFSSENNQTEKSNSGIENSDQNNPSDLEETEKTNLDSLLQEEELESFEETISMAAVTTDPEISLSSLTTTEPAELAFSNDAYLTSLFSGAAVYTYPIAVPKGIANLKPKIELSYNSQGVGGTYGWLGDGWSLNEYYISRDVNHTPNNITDDRFILVFDGQSHNLIYSGTDGFYHTEIETYAKIQKEAGGSNQKGEYWTVTTKDGTLYRFGYTSDSELLNSVPGRNYVTQWKLDQIEDVNGNLISYKYVKNLVSGESGTSYLNNISYNNGFNIIEFERTNKPVTFSGYRDGSHISEKCLLSAISIKTNGQLVYKYQLQYTPGNHVLLDSISLIGADSTSLPATTFSYDITNRDFALNSSWTIPPHIINGVRDEGVRFVDINSDGLTDLVQSSNLSGVSTKNVWINTGSNFVLNSSWSIPLHFVQNGVDQGVRFVDINGDGFVDIVQSFNSTTKSVWINTGNSFVLDSSWSIPIIFIPASASQTNQFVDINSDGLQDIVQLSCNTTQNVTVWINTGSSFALDSSWTIPANNPVGYETAINARFVDINGDGLPDVFITYGSVLSKAWINTGSSFVSDDQWTIYLFLISNPTFPDVIDINGDGLPDAVQSFNRSGISTKNVWMNTGSGFVLDPSTSIPVHFHMNGADQGVRFADVNGDGLTDIVQSFYNNIKNVWINTPNSAPYLLTQINHSSGAVTKIEYDASTHYNNIDENGTQRLPTPIRVVKKVETNNGMQNDQNTTSTLTYDYKGGLMHFEPETKTEFRGFRQVTVTDGRSIVEHYFHQDKAKKGNEYLTIIKSASDILYSETENNFITNSTDGIFEVLLNNSSTSLYDGKTIPITSKINYEYDTYGNVITIFNEGDLSITGDEKTALLEYTYNTNNWILNTVKKETVKADLQTLAEFEFYYDGHSNLNAAPTRGLMTEVIYWNNNGDDIVKEFAYDSFGNLISQTNGNGHTTTIAYGIRPIFPVSFTNALGQTTLLDYNLNIGKLEKITDPNGFETSMTYDVFGRVTGVIKPGDPSTLPTIRYQYFTDGQAPEYIQISTKKQGNEYYNMWNYYDGLGRVIKTETDSDTPSQKIISEAYYDNYGGISKIISPRKGNEPALETVNQYDSFGRLIQVTNPDGSSRQAEYSQLKTTSFDENGHKNQIDKDAYGNIIKVTEFNGNDIYETFYEYDTMGRLVKIIPNQYYDQSYIKFLVENSSIGIGGLINTKLLNLSLNSLGTSSPINTTYKVENTTFVYDSLSRQIMIDDPDLGVWTYTYTQNNKLSSQTDARGVTTEYEYDALDRLIWIDYPNDDDVIYEYDNGTIGTLSTVSSGAVTKSYYYDSKLRVVKEVVSIDGMDNSGSRSGNSIVGTPLYIQSDTIREKSKLSKLSGQPSVSIYNQTNGSYSEELKRSSKPILEINNIVTEIPIGEPSIYNQTNKSHLMEETSEMMETAVRKAPSARSSNGVFEDQEDITLQLEEIGYRVQRVDLTNLRVSMGAGDIGYIYLNNHEILKFVDSGAGGNLYIYDEAGNQLGVLSQINGKPTFENMTFDVSFIHDGSEMSIEIQKYHAGVSFGTFRYSYLTGEDILTLRAYMTGYQSNVDYIRSEYEAEYEALPNMKIEGSFVNQQDITLQLEEEGYRVQRVDLKNLRVSMGAGDVGYIYLNNHQILKFIDSSAGGSLYIYDDTGNQLGVLSPINGKPTAENMTFNISFIHDGSKMSIEIQKYYRGVLNGTFNYSYQTSEDILTLRAYMTGYQSNVDYISSEYAVEYELRPVQEVITEGSFENQQDITIQLEKAGYRVQRVDLTNLRVSMGAGDSGYIYLNDEKILKFIDSGAGGDLYVYDTYGNQLGVIWQINGKPSFENMTFDISFIHDGSEMSIEIQKYNRGIPVGTFNYSYLTDENLSELCAYMIGYQSGVDYISSEYTIHYEPLPSQEIITEGSFDNQQDITIQLKESGYRVQRVDLKNLRVSTGSGDIGYIYLNGDNILRFTYSTAGGNLLIFDQTGKQLGNIAKVNGKPTLDNMTFDISFILDGFEMSVEVQKYDKGVPAGKSKYSYLTDQEMLTLRAQLTGYQSNVDYISSGYAIYHEPLPKQTFENEEHKFISLYKRGFDLTELNFTNLRISTGVHDVGSVYLNDAEFLRFVDTPAGGTLTVFDGDGNKLGSVQGVNGHKGRENVTFDVSFVRLDASNISITLNKKENGSFSETHSFVSSFEKPIQSAQLYLQGYESSSNCISGAYDTVYVPSLEPTKKSFVNEEDITVSFEKENLAVTRLDLTDLRVAMGSGDTGSIYLNGCESLRFINNNNSLLIYDENGTVLGTITTVNGNASVSSNNMTFNISFISNESDTLIKVEKFWRGQLNSTNYYSYKTSEPVSSMRASFVGYQSNQNYINCSYDVNYEATGYDLPPYEKPYNTFEDEGDITLYLENTASTTVKQMNLDDFRVQFGESGNAYISLNGNDTLRFESTSHYRAIAVLDSTGNSIGSYIYMNSPQENTTFNVSFIRGNQTTIHIQTSEKGVVMGTYQYVYDLNESISSVRAYVDSYESGKSFVSGSYEVLNVAVTNYSSENDDPSDFITLYTYDSMDRIIQKTLPNGKVIAYNYNNQTLLSSIPGVIDNIEYNSMNLMTRKEFSNNVATDLAYDGWTKRLENIDTPGLQNIDYSFDLKGNVIGVTDNIVGENQYFFYDDLDRLILAGSETYSQSFAYNPLGSILAHRSKDMTTNTETIFGFEYGKNAGIHAPTRVGDTELLYDANGNLVEDGSFVYVYNDANRLTEVLKKAENNRSVAEFVYDENGRRVIKTEEGVVSYYISPDYDIEDGEETVYYYANGNRVAKESSEGMFWYLDDHLGSTNVMIDESGQLVERTLYYPFGGHREGGSEKYTFTGKEFDSEIGLYYYGARYYNPETFVFTQADSVIPNLYNPQALNRYSYCYNNPVNYEDPDGHIPYMVVTAATGALIGGSIGAGSEFIAQYHASGGNIWSDILNGDLSSVYAFATSDDVNWRSVGAHAASGAFYGGLAGLTMGACVSVAATGTLGASASTIASAGPNLGFGAGLANRFASSTMKGLSRSVGASAGGTLGRTFEYLWNGGREASDMISIAFSDEKIASDTSKGFVRGFLGPVAGPVAGVAVSQIVSDPVAAKTSVSNVINTASNTIGTVGNTISNAFNNNATINKIASTIKSIFS